MIGLIEHQQQRVAAPFDQPAAVVVSRGQQLAEHHVEVVRHLLGTETASGREPLGQPGKTGDVGEDQGADELARGQLGGFLQPPARELRHERLEIEWCERSALLVDKAGVLKMAGLHGRTPGARVSGGRVSSEPTQPRPAG